MAKRFSLAAACLVLILAVPAAADPWATMQKRGTLRWGGDANGGAPYLIDQGPGQPPTGFEADVAAYLAAKLGLRGQFVQKDWDMLPQDLKRGDIDIILNGYEWSPDREQEMASTIPYYIYKLQLVVGPQSSIKGWPDLPGKKVGVLSESAAHRYLKKFKDIEIIALSEEGTTGVMNLVRQGKLDATLQDVPTVLYYVQDNHGFGDLKLIGDPVEPGYYVIFLPHQDPGLCDRLNDIIRAALKDGTLKGIYDKYGLWNDDQNQLLDVAGSWPPAAKPSSESPPSGLLDYGLTLLLSTLTTIELSFLSMPLAILVGLGVAVGRLYGPRWLAWLLSVYVELLRGTPLLMQMFVVYYLLPRPLQYLHLNLSAFWAGVISLAVNYSAYEAENYRAGLLAIPRGQMEAALSLGMSRWTALRRIIIPQAVRIVIPPVTNDFISLFKDTAVCSVIAVAEMTGFLRLGELTGTFRGLMVNHPQYVVQLGLMTALLYLLMSYPLSLVARGLEQRYSRVAA